MFLKYHNFIRWKSPLYELCKSLSVPVENVDLLGRGKKCFQPVGRRLGRKNVWFSAGSRRGKAHKVFVVQAIALRAICMLRYVNIVL